MTDQNRLKCLTGPVRHHHNAGAMLIEMFGRGLAVRAPAKVNLFLEVLGKRADGYHEIDSIICPVSLQDELKFESNDSGRIEFCISTDSAQTRDDAQGAVGSHAQDPAWKIPSDASNLVVRALVAVQRELGTTAGCRVELLKRVPAAAGLGGGSSDAAAAIVAGLALWAQWDRVLAVRIASELGSDIPLFLGDERNGIGLARATRRGEQVEIISPRPALCFVISHPPVGSSTAEVYKLWRSTGERRSSEGMLAACSWNDARVASGELDATNKLDAARKIEESLFNALQSPSSQLTDWIARQLQYFAELNRPQAIMSGSGSACFALVESPTEGHEMVKKLIALGLPRAYVAHAWYAPPIEQQLERTFQTLP